MTTTTCGLPVWKLGDSVLDVRARFYLDECVSTIWCLDQKIRSTVSRELWLTLQNRIPDERGDGIDAYHLLEEVVRQRGSDADVNVLKTNSNCIDRGGSIGIIHPRTEYFPTRFDDALELSGISEVHPLDGLLEGNTNDESVRSIHDVPGNEIAIVTEEDDHSVARRWQEAVIPPPGWAR